MEEWRKAIEQRLASYELRLTEGDHRMTSMESAIKENTELTRQVVDNTSGFASFFNDVESGARFMCRMARGISWLLKEVVEPFWKPVLVVFLVGYWLMNEHHLPDFVTALMKAFA